MERVIEWGCWGEHRGSDYVERGDRDTEPAGPGAPEAYTDAAERLRIHAAVGSGGGTGTPRGKRSGCAA